MVGYRSPTPLIWVRILVPVQINIMSSLVNFVKDSYVEFTQKVEWPKWNELRSSTIVVTVATIILAIFLFGVDEVFSTAIRNIIQILVNLFN